MPRRNSGYRNPVARSPLLRKGGVHTESKTGQRLKVRLSTHSAINEWLDEDEIETTKNEDQNGEQTLPRFFVASRHL